MENKVLLAKKSFVQTLRTKYKNFDKLQWKATLALCSCVFCVSCATSSRVEEVEDVTKRSEENMLALSYQVANLEAKIDAVHTEMGNMEGRTYEVLNKSGKKTGWTARAVVPVEHASPISGASSSSQGAAAQSTKPKQTANNTPAPKNNTPPNTASGAASTTGGNSSPTLLLPPQEAPASTAAPAKTAPTNVAGDVPTSTPKESAPAPMTSTPNTPAPTTPAQGSLQTTPSATAPVVALPPTTSDAPVTPAQAAIDPSVESTPVVAHSQRLPAPTAGEQAMYKEGLDLVLAGKSDAGRTKLTEFLNQYPAGRLTANAYYWIGESLYSQGKFADALMAFKQGSLRFPTHDKTADSLLKAGMTYDKLGDAANARVQYEAVVLNFPNSNAANIARSKIRR